MSVISLSIMISVILIVILFFWEYGLEKQS